MNAKIGRPKTGRMPNFSIRIDPIALQVARDAAITSKKTLGQWLKEAIMKKFESEKKLDKEA